MQRVGLIGMIGWLALWLASALVAQPFTYQGMLKQNGQPVNGTLTMTFTLYHTILGQIGSPITRSVLVQNGLFTVELDFGSLWYGPWLELEIKIGAAPNETVLSPRVKLTGAPYAINALYSLKPWEPNGSAIFYNGGNVGIGTHNPWALLSLGSSNADTKLALWQGNSTGQIMGLGVGPGQFRLHLHNPTNRFSFLDAPNGSELVTIKGDGNVGIGTSNPAAQLSLGGGNADTKLALWQGSSASEMMGLGVGAGQFRLHLNNAGDRFSFLDAPNGNELVTIQGDGKVGIGTSIPSQQLHVVATTASSAIYGHHSATTGETYGVDGRSESPQGTGVVGWATATTGFTNGVYGLSTSTSGTGVVGWVPATRGPTYGVYGLSDSREGRGVVGWATSSLGVTYGVYGRSDSIFGIGVSGIATATTYGGTGVFGENNSSDGYAVYAHGRFVATGTKSFQIDHPLDPENAYLNHFCTEAPEPLNAYSGNVVTDAQGYAVVQLPPYFETINRDFRYQLTCIGQFAQAIVAEKIRNNRFVIRTDKPNVEVSWRVEAVRNDRWVQQYGFQTEQPKPDAHKGKYLHPELYGQPKEKGIHYRPEPERPVEPMRPEPERPAEPTREETRPN